MQRILTATGKEFKVIWCAISSFDGILRFNMLNCDFATAVSVFSNVDETNVIIHKVDNETTEYSGYTALRGIEIDALNRITIALSKA